MKIKIIECKGDSISIYKDLVECDFYEIKHNHISIFKNRIQIFHLPARYFGIEVIS